MYATILFVDDQNNFARLWRYEVEKYELNGYGPAY
jgi:hypothetical protein